MSNMILAPTAVVDGDYQRLRGDFRPDADGIYYIGIFASLDGNPWYISIDDITIEETPMDPIFVLDPASWDYGRTQLGLSATKVFTISNDSGGTLFIHKDDLVITGDDAAEFSLSPISENISLTVDQSAQISISFSPSSEGLKSATLQIIDNMPSAKGSGAKSAKAIQTLALSGECFDTTISTFPYTQDFDSVDGQSIPNGWTVINANEDYSTWYID